MFAPLSSSLSDLWTFVCPFKWDSVSLQFHRSLTQLLNYFRRNLHFFVAAVAFAFFFEACKGHDTLSCRSADKQRWANTSKHMQYLASFYSLL